MADHDTSDGDGFARQQAQRHVAEGMADHDTNDGYAIVQQQTQRHVAHGMAGHDTNNGDKFAKKILTSGEYKKYSDIKLKHQKAQYVAKCWAVKEAFVKALGTGFTKDYSWSTIEYFSPIGTYGPAHPQVRLTKLLEKKNVHLSVSDEKENVIAFVTIEEIV